MSGAIATAVAVVALIAKPVGDAVQRARAGRRRRRLVADRKMLADALLAEYERGAAVSETEGHRRMGLAILSNALESGLLTPEASRLLDRIRRALASSPLNGDEQDRFFDELEGFMIAKNGSWLVEKDREDKSVKAALAAFESSRDPDGTPSDLAYWAAEHLLGTSGNMTLA